MASDTYLFLFGLFDIGALLFLTVYFVITLSDLECDYLNAQQCCSKLNMCVLPEIISHGLLTLFLLLGGQWILLLLNSPMTAWQIYKYVTVPSGNVGIYDPTEIHNRGNLKVHMKESLIKLGYYLVFFFIYLYCMIVSLLTKDPSSVVGIHDGEEY
ncbi:hypothetical protein CHUAL_006567 [Chamberlinius hualienensis]